jgi:PIN domain nuclease of toxin-antitoxin system
LKLLVDSHVLLWWLARPEKISEEALNALESVENELFISAASWWELAIKKSLKRVQFDPAAISALLDRANARRLAVTFAHAETAAALPVHHSDPFDRMLVAQAVAEDLVLLTRDKELARYDVALFRA